METAPAPEATPSLPRRLLMAFVEPGALAEALRARPAWFTALLVGAVLVMISNLVIPVEIWQEMMRAQMMASGQELPEGAAEMGANIGRIFAVVGGLLFWGIWAFLLSGVTTLVFGFILGDEGRFKQYLAMTSHALVIMAVGTLLVAPLRIAQRNPQLMLSVGTLVGDLEGWAGRFLNGLDLFALWAFVVLAVGVATFDRKRSFGSALTVLLVFWLGITALFALIPTPG